MTDDSPFSRREILTAGASSALFGVAGCAGVSGSGFQESSDDPSPPVVDNAADDPTHTLVIDVNVEDASGAPVTNATVLLHDRGGTPDDRRGTTGSQGRIRFLESVGPPPCNTQTVEVPEYGVVRRLGCNNGGQSIQETIVVGSDGGDTGSVDYPVVDNAADDPSRNLTIDLQIEDESGEPLGETTVLLHDRGGTPDDRRGTTGPQGRIRFLESVGPPPCNTQTVEVPEYAVVRRLGCNNGGQSIQETIVVGSVQGEGSPV